MARKATRSERPKKPHAHWEKVVAYAYLRMDGRTQEDGARGVGRARRTVQLWEANKELWAAARQEARERWYGDAEDASRSAIMRSVRLGNADLGLRLLERLDKKLAPPKQTHEHSGKDGAPIAIEVYGDKPEGAE